MMRPKTDASLTVDVHELAARKFLEFPRSLAYLKSSPDVISKLSHPEGTHHDFCGTFLLYAAECHVRDRQVVQWQ